MKFELKDYNAISQDAGYEEEQSDMLISDSMENENTGLSALMEFVIFLFAIGAWISMYIIVAVMAQKRHRSVVIWVLLSMIASPLLIIFILFFVGSDNRHIGQYGK